MYWLREVNAINITGWLLSILLWSTGGYLIITHFFRLEKQEATILGFGFGLILYLWLCNLVGHFLSPSLTFSLPAIIILAAGLAAHKFSFKIVIEKPFLRQLSGQIIIMLILTIFFTLIGRGLAIFDERKNLTMISQLANGDIPPHNPLNPTTLYQYHYGSQLLGASLVRLGNFFPWSAFDISKGVYWALTILLIYCILQRHTKKTGAAFVLTAVYTLLSGTRYLLMLLPGTFLAGLNERIALLGSSQDIGLPFSQAVFSDWVIGGGPLDPYPYGFVNGIFRPLIMAHSGTGTFAFAMVLMIWLLISPELHRSAKWILAILLAQLALTWETTYGLLLLAVGILFIWKLLIKRSRDNSFINILLQAALISVPIVLVQGGTFTEIIHGFISGLISTPGAAGISNSSHTMFTLNWPPVIYSSHLGGLSILEPELLLVGLCELGPVIFFIPTIWKWLTNKTTSQPSSKQLMFVAALIGLLIPVFLTYVSSPRDITRFSDFGLSILSILLLLFVLDKWSIIGMWMRIFSLASITLMSLSGLMVGVVQLSAIRSPVLSEGMDGWDARLSARVWGNLPDNGWIFDPSNFPWRAAVLTGNPTLISSDSFSQSELDSLRQHPTITGFRKYGYEYVYIDEDWWKTLSLTDQQELEQTCVKEIAGISDAENGITRRILSIADCKVSDMTRSK